MASTKAQKTILANLRALYPDAKPELRFTNPYETLVAVMLSAQSTDVQVNKVTPALFQTYPTIESMAAARVEDVYAMVRSCGFKSKAGNIVQTCRLLMLRHGGQVPASMEALVELPGVGRKTANVVLANAFSVPTIAVDTHVFRVSNRTGLATAKTVEQTEAQLQTVIPQADWIAAHHWLIFHGRRVCHARKPNCEGCALYPECRFVQPTKVPKKAAQTAAKLVKAGENRANDLPKAAAEKASSATKAAAQAPANAIKAVPQKPANATKTAPTRRKGNKLP